MDARIAAAHNAREDQESLGAPIRVSTSPRLVGPGERLQIATSARLDKAFLETTAGSIAIASDAFIGAGASLLTDPINRGPGHRIAVGSTGNDVHVGAGAWIGPSAIVVGPCRIGENAIVKPGAFVIGDVPAAAVVAGLPARIVGKVEVPMEMPPAVALTTDVGTLLAHEHDEVITVFLRAYGSWEADDRRLLLEHLALGAVVIDVGANIGYTAIAAARAVGPDGRVIAVEPHPKNVALLRANLALNEVSEQVQVIGAAAWSSPAMVELAESPDNAGDHRVQGSFDGRATVTVEAVRLDEVIPKGLRVRVMKIDTQASEHHVLRGAEAILARDRPVILCEYWPRGLEARGDDPLSVLTELRGHGYEVEVPHDPMLATLDDAALAAAIDRLTTHPLGGFATLLLVPRH